MKSWTDKIESFENKKRFCRTVVKSIEKAALGVEACVSQPTFSEEDAARSLRVKLEAPSEECVLKCARLLKNFWNHVTPYDVGLLYTEATIAKINAIVASKTRD